MNSFARWLMASLLVVPVVFLLLWTVLVYVIGLAVDSVMRATNAVWRRLWVLMDKEARRGADRKIHIAEKVVVKHG